MDPAEGSAKATLVVTCSFLSPAGLPTLDANDPENKNDPFYYDWYSLRVGGLICAGILCALGIIVLMSGKCKCKFRQKPSHRPGEGPPLITPGSAHNC